MKLIDIRNDPVVYDIKLEINQLDLRQLIQTLSIF